MEGVVEDWTKFDVRAGGPPMSAVEPFIAPPEVQPAINDLLVELQQSLAEPVRGITCDGTVTPGLCQRRLKIDPLATTRGHFSGVADTLKVRWNLDFQGPTSEGDAGDVGGRVRRTPVEIGSAQVEPGQVAEVALLATLDENAQLAARRAG
jgi:hypothetical protein